MRVKLRVDSHSYTFIVFPTFYAIEFASSTVVRLVIAFFTFKSPNVDLKSMVTVLSFNALLQTSAKVYQFLLLFYHLTHISLLSVHPIMKNEDHLFPFQPHS